jgi:hypothetical protein
VTSPLTPGINLEEFNPERRLLPDSARQAAHGAVGSPSETERSTVRTVVVLTLAAILAAKGRDWLKLAQGWERNGRFDRAAFDREVTSTFTEVFRKPLVPLLSGMLQLGRQSLVDSLDIDIVQRGSALKVADAWATKYADAVAEDFGRQSALAIARSLPEWLNRRLPASALATRAKDIYGLDPRAAVAYENYASGKTVTRDMSLRSLAEKALERRAQITGQVHSFTALNFGRQMLFAEGVGEGIIPVSARKVWVTAVDERVCPWCRPMDGVAVPVLDRFEINVAGKHHKLVVPPVHPNCRCTVVLDQKFKNGIITRTARFDDQGPNHLARLVSDAKDLVLR